MIFELKRRNALYQLAVSRMVARTAGLTDVDDASSLAHALAGPAAIVEQLFFETARLLDLFSIDRATGPDLDARALDYIPDALTRTGATKAVGTGRWTRPVALGTAVTIPAGTIFAQTGNAQVTYITTAPGEIPIDGTQSIRTDGPGGDIPARAVVAGAAGNALAGTASKIITPIAGATLVTNPLPFTGGVDAETDDVFRARIVAHVSTLARCTPPAIEARALEAVLDGHQVTIAAYRLEPWEVATATVYIDDGSGSIESYETADLEVLITSATGGETRFYTDYWPLRGDAWTVSRVPDGELPIELEQDVDYKVIPATGLIVLSPTQFPTGLTAGDGLVISPYNYYTGLIAEAQRLINGDPSDPVTYPAWYGGGVFIRVKAPNVRWVVVRCTIAVLDGYDRDTARDLVQQAISDYINNLTVGVDVIYARLIDVAMSVAGMYDVQFDQPTVNIPVADVEIARATLSNIEVT